VRSFQYNFTNEGGFVILPVLKNISGLWLLQEYKREKPKSRIIPTPSSAKWPDATLPGVIDPDAPDL